MKKLISGSAFAIVLTLIGNIVNAGMLLWDKNEVFNSIANAGSSNLSQLRHGSIFDEPSNLELSKIVWKCINTPNYIGACFTIAFGNANEGIFLGRIDGWSDMGVDSAYQPAESITHEIFAPINDGLNFVQSKSQTGIDEFTIAANAPGPESSVFLFSFAGLIGLVGHRQLRMKDGVY